MSDDKPIRVHLVVGGFPPGEPAGHDMDYVRLKLLEVLHETPRARVTVSSDYRDIARWLETSRFLITYAAGPYPDEDGNPRSSSGSKQEDDGSRCMAPSGGKAAPVGESRRVRKMVKMPHHATLGAFFLNHPPARKFRVNVAQENPLAAGLPASFEVMDELYMIELQDPAHSEIFLTTRACEESRAEFRLRL